LRQLFRNKIFIGALLAVGLILSAIAWRHSEENRLADVNGAAITSREVDTALGRPLAQLYQQIYNLQKQKLDQLIDAKLLDEEAKKRGIPVAKLIEQEVNAKILPVTDDEIETLYKANKARIPVELENVKEKIRDFIRDQRLMAQKQLFIKSLRERAKVVTYLQPPPVFRVGVSVNGEPHKGPEKAPVTIVKFEDFQCPFCKQVQPTFVELLKRYAGKVRLVHKDLPLQDIHPLARQAAEAARCADEQGKFWSYHDKLYASSPKLTTEDLKSYAKEVGLDSSAFDTCVASGKYKSLVQKDLAEGEKLGLTGTPAFFINGREISGAQPLEAFAAVIDEELARAK
jgi:protein-disulfide isomerase